jgi:hypothetical protein
MVRIATKSRSFSSSSKFLTIFTESVLPISSLVFGTGHNSSDALDYFHINSVDRSRSSGSYLISGRHTSTIYKINGTTGSIIWRLGGPLSNFTLQPGVEFGFQHHARFLSSDRDTETISFPERPLDSMRINPAGRSSL